MEPRERKRGPGRCKTGSAWLVFGLLLFVYTHPLYSADPQQSPTEAQVKAAYLYNFGKFVRWQAPVESDTFDICVLGKNPFGTALSSTIADEHIDGKSIVARNVDGVGGTSRCKILFISTSEEPRLKSAIAVSQKSSTLTVSDIPKFAEHGGMIGLVNVGGRIRFEVNLKAVNKVGIVISSELLKVAVNVVGMDQSKEVDK